MEDLVGLEHQIAFAREEALRNPRRKNERACQIESTEHQRVRKANEMKCGCRTDEKAQGESNDVLQHVLGCFDVLLSTQVRDVDERSDACTKLAIVEHGGGKS